MPPKPTPAVDRFWPKVAQTDTCWLWTGCTATRGYGHLYVDGRNVRVHRFAYELLVGPIPSGMVIDHLCRVRSCVNPDHMEVVTHEENLRRQIPCLEKPWLRKTHCPRGHEKTGDNLYVTPDGRHVCRECTERSRVRYRQRLAGDAERDAREAAQVEREDDAA